MADKTDDASTAQKAATDQLADTNDLLAEWAAASTEDSPALVERLEQMGYEVRGKSQEEVARLIWEIIQTGLLLPVDQTYSLYVLAHEKEMVGIQQGVSLDKGVYFRFLHDRCQQAAYKIIPEGQRAFMRIRIGRSILQHTSEDQLDQVVTDIVEHFNAGYTLLETTTGIERRPFSVNFFGTVYDSYFINENGV